MKQTDGGGDSALGRAAADWATLRSVEVAGVPVRYREAGSGEPVVLVHGLGMMSDYWFRTGPLLAAGGYRVLAPDLPGFGRSPGGAGGLPIPAQVSALLAWAGKMELPPSAFVGHSLGCQAVLELAVHSPELVTKIVLAAPTGPGGIREMSREAVALFVDAWRENWKLLMMAGSAYLRAGPLRFLATWHRESWRDPMLLLPQIPVPALVMVGERDPVVREEFARSMAAGLPRGELVVMPEEAHALSFRRPERFSDAVLEFMRRKVAPCGGVARQPPR